MLAVDLARVANHLSARRSRIHRNRAAPEPFIYLVLTSLFRVFYPGLAGQAIPLATPRAPIIPKPMRPHVDKMIALLEGEHVYRQMRLNRARLAEMVGIGEHHLSRVINGHFGKNFNELINSYRIEEAKQRLGSEATQITVIGFETGFNSIASFNRVFKEKAGVSPTEYRATKNIA